MAKRNREDIIEKEEDLIEHLEEKEEEAGMALSDSEAIGDGLIVTENVKIRSEEIIAMIRLPEDAKKKDIISAWEGDAPIEDICQGAKAKTLVVTAKKSYLSPEPLPTWKKRYDEANFLNLKK